MQKSRNQTERHDATHAPADGELGYIRFEDSHSFATFADRFGLDYHGRDERYPATPFVWAPAPAVFVRTGCNPLTGETAGGDRARRGYAASVRIQGYDADTTADVYRSLVDAAASATEQFTPLTTADGSVISSYGGWE